MRTITPRGTPDTGTSRARSNSAGRDADLIPNPPDRRPRVGQPRRLKERDRYSIGWRDAGDAEQAGGMEDALAYALRPGDNGSFMFGHELAPRCRACTLVTDAEWINPTFVLVERGLDVSVTYDGCLVSSRRFANLVDGLPGIRTRAIPAAPGFFSTVVDPIVPFDTERRGTRSQDRCGRCGRFKVVIGATPVYLRDGAVVPPGFSRTDVVFGDAADFGASPTAQSPIILVDTTTAATLRAERLAGMELVPVR